MTSAIRYVHQYDEELSDLKKARRPGRPASTKEDLLKVRISTLQKEYENGFCELHAPVLSNPSPLIGFQYSLP